MWPTDLGSLPSGLGSQVDLEKSESRILRIARGSGTHPDEVRGLLKMHKHFEKVFGKMGKNMKGDASKVKQLQVRGLRRGHRRLALRPVGIVPYAAITDSRWRWVYPS